MEATPERRESEANHRDLAFALEGVRVERAGKAILSDISLVAGSTARIALIGPSGAGKTTLLRLLAGAFAPTAGHVSVLRESLSSAGAAKRRALRARIGFVHQQHALVPMLRVLQNVAAGRLGRHGTIAGLRRVLLPSRAEAVEIHAVLERVGIGETLYARVDRLSGGEQQRVAIARTLYQGAQLLLADEPVASVDPARARSIVELLLQITDEGGLPLVCSLHDVDLATQLFPRVIGLRAGRIEFDVSRRPGEPSVRLDPAVVERLYRLESPA